ncbi:MAG: DUF4249 family protein [Bacteroidota bacterium]
MKLSQTLFLIFVISLFLQACEEINAVETIDELSIEAYLFPNKPVTGVHISKVIPLDSTQAEEAPRDIEPLIIDEQGTPWLLSWSAEDSTYQNLDLVIEEGKTYRLELAYKGKTISAETLIPTAPQQLQISQTSVGRVLIDDFTDLQNQTFPDPVELNWADEENAYFFVEVRNTESNPDPINQLFDDGQGPPRFSDQTEPSTASYYALNTIRDLTHFGNHVIIVYRVNPEYVALYEDNSSGTGTLNEIRTNVQNGFGIFTGVNSASVSFFVKRE